MKKAKKGIGKNVISMVLAGALVAIILLLSNNTDLFAFFMILTHYNFYLFPTSSRQKRLCFSAPVSYFLRCFFGVLW